MLTITRLARRFGLARSTLLYYDAIGLLSPAARSEAGYRLYSPADVARMEAIQVYRRAGLPLADIARVLATTGRGGELSILLRRRLHALQDEVRSLQRQQQLLTRLLKGAPAARGATRRPRRLDKVRWIQILRSTGLDDDGLRRWHSEFERLSPNGHQDFLELLGIPHRDIVRIRERSRAGAKAR